MVGNPSHTGRRRAELGHHVDGIFAKPRSTSRTATSLGTNGGHDVPTDGGGVLIPSRAVASRTGIAYCLVIRDVPEQRAVWAIEGGLQPGPARDGQVIVLFGARPDLLGWQVVDEGRPGPDLRGRVRPLAP